MATDTHPERLPEECREFRARTQEALLGELSPPELESRDAHRAGCVLCQEEHDRAASEWNLIAELAEPTAPPPEVIEGLRARIAAHPAAAEPASEPATPRSTQESIEAATSMSRRSSLLTYAGLAAAAMLAGVLFTSGGNQSQTGQTADEEIARMQIAEAERRIAEAMRIARPATSTPEVHQAAVRLEAGDTASAVLVLQDQFAQAHFYGIGLPPAPRGAVYRLWFRLEADRWRFAGELQQDGDAHKLLTPLVEGETILAALLTTQPAGPAGKAPPESGRLMEIPVKP